MIGNTGAFMGALLGLGATLLALFSILRAERERRDAAKEQSSPQPASAPSGQARSVAPTRSDVFSALGALLAGAGAAVAFFDPALEFGRDHYPLLWVVLAVLGVVAGVLTWLTYR